MRNFAFNNGRSAYSSMDRIKDSGSFDWGSTPHGRTIRFLSIVLDNQGGRFFIGVGHDVEQPRYPYIGFGNRIGV